ncbi:MAG: UDP-N-acetylglucosamine 2-epimerase (non-hydrolyzing) [bacterium]|nr:UDP-N-acetylglucosamine 2-epimerase (non-hydrolyzing) [bacterium]
MSKPLVFFVLGTRPEAIKCAPVILRARRDSEIEVEVVVTSQHRELQDEVLAAFGVEPDFDLNLMKEKSDLTSLVAGAWTGLSRRMEERKPAMTLVQGDTTTACIAAMAAHYQRVAVGHIEAGLRTYNKFHPFPEESNRRMISAIADLNFAPTAQARENLLRENIPPDTIHVVGNPGIDALLYMVERARTSRSRPAAAPSGRRLILVTCHRRENWGENLQNICLALKDLSERTPDCQILFAVHPNPVVRETAERVLAGVPGVELRGPAPYPEMAALLGEAALVLTDSGGIQEEAPVLGKPVLVMRETTERPEGVAGETARLVGADRALIVESALSLLNDESEYRRRAVRRSPFGDGRAAERIWQGVRHYFNLAPAPEPFLPV